MEAKRGDGLIFVNCMEKLTMNAPRETLRTRLAAALDAGIDGITLAAGLHLGSFALMEDHPRFRDAKLGIIVSSVRALQLFLRKIAKLESPARLRHRRRPAGRRPSRLRHGLGEIRPAHHRHRNPAWMAAEKLTFRSFPAGGIFTGSDAVASWKAARRRCRWRRASPSRTNAACRPKVQAGILQGQRRRTSRST